MTGLEYIEEYFKDNGVFEHKEDKEWFASLLDDYATNYHRASVNVFYIFLSACCFWRKKQETKEPINKLKDEIKPREIMKM